MQLMGFAPDVPPAQRRRVVAVLFLAVLGMSTSGVLVRGADATPLAVAAWRTLGAGALLLPAVLREARRVSARDHAWLLASGGMLAGHFWIWFASLDHTTILRSTLLVCLVPLWTGLLEALLFRRPIHHAAAERIGPLELLLLPVLRFRTHDHGHINVP